MESLILLIRCIKDIKEGLGQVIVLETQNPLLLCLLLGVRTRGSSTSLYFGETTNETTKKHAILVKQPKSMHTK